MKFGSVALEEAQDAILAHSQRLGDRRLRKGTRLTGDDIAALRAAGYRDVVAARLEPGDIAEDDAAEALAEPLAGQGIRAGPAATGRVNFFAEAAGLFLPDRSIVDALNDVDPGITLATLAEYASVKAGRMVATVKIIPLSVPGSAVDAALRLMAQRPAFRLAVYRPRPVALIQTELPSVKSSVLDKTRAALRKRLDVSGSTLALELRCDHETEALAAAIVQADAAELVVVFGASAVIDTADVIPAAIRAAGGEVLHLGMPVDPGNLLLLGRLGDRPVIGAPGCARSLKENGFDWILNRLLAGLEVTGEIVRGMGVGGLLMEIASRPQPREAEPVSNAPVVDVLILAAGKSSRMGGPNKLLATFDGVPLVRRSAETALASRAGRVRVVVGHMRNDIMAALGGLNIEIIENPAFAEGLSTSLIVGFADSTRTADGVMVMLADQPLITSADLDRLIEAFRPTGAGSIVLAADRGRRANPVILASSYGPEISALAGDVGARGVVAAHAEAVREVEIGEAASLDVDTPEALRAAGGRLSG